MLVPTKGCHSDDKLEQIHKEIEEQKKKLNLLEHGLDDKNKMDRTRKLGGEPRKYEKSKK
jgi:hypothetical protein